MSPKYKALGVILKYRLLTINTDKIGIIGAQKASNKIDEGFMSFANSLIAYGSSSFQALAQNASLLLMVLIEFVKVQSLLVNHNDLTS